MAPSPREEESFFFLKRKWTQDGAESALVRVDGYCIEVLSGSLDAVPSCFVHNILIDLLAGVVEPEQLTS
jgi:hypothetical protein